MGWLSTITKIAAIGGAPFTGGASLALLGADVGAQLIGAKLSSNASKNAAKTQAAAGQKAIDIEQAGQRNALGAVNDAYAKTSGIYSPYMQMGQSAIPSLMNLAGSGYNGPGSTPTPQMTQPPPMMAPQGQSAPQGIYGPPQGQPSMRYAGSGQTPAAAAQGGGMVTLKAPNGNIAQVPAAQAAHYISMGAEQVG